MKPPSQPPEFPLAELLRVGFTEVPAPVWVSVGPLVRGIGIASLVLTALLWLNNNPLDGVWGLRYFYVASATVCGALIALERNAIRGYHYAQNLRSARSGQVMFCFRRSDATDGQEEYVYVDQESRTYFCMVVTQPAAKQTS